MIVSFPYDASLVTVRRTSAPNARWIGASKNWEMTEGDAEAFRRAADEALTREGRTVPVWIGDERVVLGKLPEGQRQIIRESRGKTDGAVGAIEWIDNTPLRITSSSKRFVDEGSSMGYSREEVWVLTMTVTPIPAQEAAKLIAERHERQASYGLDDGTKWVAGQIDKFLHTLWPTAEIIDHQRGGQLQSFAITNSQSLFLRFDGDRITWRSMYLYDVDDFFAAEKETRSCQLAEDVADVIASALTAIGAAKNNGQSATARFGVLQDASVALRRLYTQAAGAEFDEGRTVAKFRRLLESN